MANCFNPTCKCKDLEIVREIILRCTNCKCAVKVESRNLHLQLDALAIQNEDLLFTVTKNAE
jgi:hypothetical protein